jgi:glycosyltransferase involved in cell wall biosynthesis
MEEIKLQKEITVVIPAYKAEKTIKKTLESIAGQTIADKLEVVVACDNPSDDYSKITSQFPELDIKQIKCTKNVGPGLARQHGLDAATTHWVTFIDADDQFAGPFALEQLKHGIEQNVIEVQGQFAQACPVPNQRTRFVLHNEPTHPWVFGRLYNVDFLRQNKVSFSELRAMEDGEFNWKVRLITEGTPLKIKLIQDVVYYWMPGSEHSITRTGEKDGIPQYNFDLCQIGATIAAKQATDFARKVNPFNGSITRFITEQMIGHYFTYIECIGRRKEFAEQNLWLGKYFYNECYKSIEAGISEDIIKNMYTQMNAAKASSLVGIIPQISFFDWFKKIKKDDYKIEEIKSIRAKLSKEIIDNDIKTGVIDEDCSIFH